MKTREEVLEMIGNRIDTMMLDKYISRQWLRPIPNAEGSHFQEIDIARLQLICHLTQEIKVNDDGIDVVLSLLDQLYGLRVDMQKFTHAIAQQSSQIQTDIMIAIEKLK